MADHKHAVQNAEGVRGTDMNGNVVVLAKTHPEQLVLFQTFLSDEDDNGHGDEKYSNTIELYDAVPKYFSNPNGIPCDASESRGGTSVPLTPSSWPAESNGTPGIALLTANLRKD